eukprot:2938137-Alexandrium_andersonii.AAC.1
MITPQKSLRVTLLMLFVVLVLGKHRAACVQVGGTGLQADIRRGELRLPEGHPPRHCALDVGALAVLDSSSHVNSVNTHDVACRHLPAEAPCVGRAVAVSHMAGGHLDGHSSLQDT